MNARWRRTRGKGLVAMAVMLAGVSSAHAHLMNTGLGPFYDGLAHLFFTPEDLLPVIALALLAGLRGPDFGRAALFTLPASWIVGSAAGRWIPLPAGLLAATALLTVAIGALAAADRPVSRAIVMGCAVALGLLRGGLSGIELARTGSGASAEAGVAVALFVLVAILAGHVSTLRAMWARVAVRVAASWIAAAGLFMLGWALRTAAASPATR